MFRKLAAALVAPLLLTAACATEADQGAVEVRTGPAAAATLRAVPERTDEVGTGAFELTFDMTMMGESLRMSATGAMDFDAQRMTMVMDMGAMFDDLADATGDTIPDELVGPIEYVADGATMYMRAPMLDALMGSSGWISVSPEDLGTTAEGLGLGVGAYDPSSFLDGLRGVTGDPERVGEEDVRGVATTHYTATMDMDRALAAAPEAQRDLLEAQLEQLGDAEVTMDVWVDGDGLLRRMEMDMGEMLAAMGTGGAATMTMELFDYGAPVDIQLPSPDEVTPLREVIVGAGGLFGDPS